MSTVHPSYGLQLALNAPPNLLHPQPSLFLHNSARSFAFYNLFHTQKNVSDLFLITIWGNSATHFHFDILFVSPTILYLCFLIIYLSQRHCEFHEERNYVFETDMPSSAIEPCLEYLFNKCLLTKYMKALPTHPYSFPIEIYSVLIK